MTLQLLEQEEGHLLDLLRAQLAIDWNQERSHPLKGGLSGAAVTRLAFTWRGSSSIDHSAVHPLLLQRTADPATTGVNSTIVKIGDRTALAREAAAYAQIPERYQHYFGRILSGPHYASTEPTAYLLLEDLTGYMTLEEVLCSGDKQLLDAMLEQFIIYLQRVYAMPIASVARPDLINQIYLTPIYQSLQALHDYHPYLLGFDAIYTALERQLITIQHHDRALDDFPRTVMHGDLHLRNIMLREIRPETGDIDFRLIDLEKFSTTGDLAYDLGELSMALATLGNDQDLPYSLHWISQTVEETFNAAAEQLGDWSFLARLELAKVRSLLKLKEIELEAILPHLLSPLLPPGQEGPVDQPTILIQLDLEQIEQHLANAIGFMTTALGAR